MHAQQRSVAKEEQQGLAWADDSILELADRIRTHARTLLGLRVRRGN